MRCFHLIFLCLGFISPKLSAQCTYQVGNHNATFTNLDVLHEDFLLGVKYTVPYRGTITALNLFGRGTLANVQMALYEDSAGVPNNLITSSVQGTVTNGNISLSVTPTQLAAGDYWIMAVYDAGNRHTFRTTTVTKDVYYQAHTFGTSIPNDASSFLTYCCRDFRYWMTIDASDTIRGVDTIKSCGAYTWIDGQTYTVSDSTATHTLTSSVGCDSVVRLDLNVVNIDLTLTKSALTLTANESGAFYQWLDCNKNFAIIPNETNQSYTTNVDGNFAVEITQNGCVDTSACYEVLTGISLKEHDWKNKLSVYPNPTEGDFTIDLDVIMYQKLTVTIYDFTGKSIFSKAFYSGQSMDLRLDGKPGIFLVKVESETKGLQIAIPLIKY